MGNNKSKYDLTEAKVLYMDFKPLKDIAASTGINYRTLLYHSKKWDGERNLMRNELLREISENKKAVLTSLTGNSLDCIDKAIKDLKFRQQAPTIHEARMLTNIVAEIDKIMRLDDGNPTDIIAEHKPTTIIELREKLKVDPFYIEDGSFTEVKNDKECKESTDIDRSDPSIPSSSGSSKGGSNS